MAPFEDVSDPAKTPDLMGHVIALTAQVSELAAETRRMGSHMARLEPTVGKVEDVLETIVADRKAHDERIAVLERESRNARRWRERLSGIWLGVMGLLTLGGGLYAVIRALR